MILDGPRVAAIRRAIDLHVLPDKAFLELGTGSGLFLEYARHKCRKVTGVEKDGAILDIARNSLASPGPLNWELIAADALHVQLPDRYDIILCEMLSTWCIIEPQVSVMRNAIGRFGNPEADIIPIRIINLIELGSTLFGVGPVNLPTPYLALTGIRLPTIMSLSQVAHVIDFSEVNEQQDFVNEKVTLEVLASGEVNCVRLSSLVELAPGVTWYSSDTLMPQLIYPLQEPAQVVGGSRVTLEYNCRYGAGLEETSFRLESVNTSGLTI